VSGKIRRRHFIPLLGATLTTLGWSHLGIHQQARQYNRVLAQSTPRKLALLVGINDYPAGFSTLRGCLTDVEMQYELLVNRYGFNPRDILVVSDLALSLPGQTIIAPPTRANILEAFESHLIDQARPDDVVIFHYSGHGSYVQDLNGISESNGLNGTIVPTDARVAAAPQSGNAASVPANAEVDDIMGKTLFLLSLALQTEYVTIVLDSCHSGGGIRGNTVIRAIEAAGARPSDRELAYQTGWIERLKLTPEAVQSRRQQGIAKGVALGSAQIDQLAVEVPFEGFHAGAFTYLLTRYLWQLPSHQPLSDTFVNISRSTRDVANTSGILQDPVYATSPDRDWTDSPPYLLSPLRSPAEAVLRGTEGDRVSFWLGGLSTGSLSAQQVIFNVIDDREQPIAEVVQTGRQGLLGRGRILSTRQALQAGLLLREHIREIPPQLSLRVGVTADMAESMVALSQLNDLSRIEGVTVSPNQRVDYLLARLTETGQQQPRQRQAAIAAPLNSIGLFTPALTPVPETFGETDESVQAAIARLRPRLKMLLAGKMLAALVNGDTSALNVEITILKVADQTPIVALGSRSAYEAGQTGTVISSAATLVAGTEIQVQIQNHEAQALFASILSIASTGEMAILHPVNWDAPEDASRIGASQTLRVPDLSAEFNRFRFVPEGPAGFFELIVIVSADPIRGALRSLQTIARGRGTRSGNPLAFVEGARSADESEDAPVTVVDSLLVDLDQGTRGLGVVGEPSSNEARRVAAQRLAAFSVVVEVVD